MEKVTLGHCVEELPSIVAAAVTDNDRRRQSQEAEYSDYYSQIVEGASEERMNIGLNQGAQLELMYLSAIISKQLAGLRIGLVAKSHGQRSRRATDDRSF